MSVQEIESEIEALPAEERRQLAAFLVTLRHKDLVGHRPAIAKKIDDASPENRLSLEEYDQRLKSWDGLQAAHLH